MAAYIKTLQDATTGDYIYPRTKSEAIIDDDGESLSETINNLKALAETMTSDIANNPNLFSSRINLFDHTQVITGVVVGTTYNVSNVNDTHIKEGWATGNIMPVSGGEKYTYNFRPNHTLDGVAIYGANQLCLGSVAAVINADGTRTVTMPADACFARFNFVINDLPASEFTKFMFVQGESLPPFYIPGTKKLIGVEISTLDCAADVKESIENAINQTRVAVDCPPYFDFVAGEIAYLYSNGLVDTNDFDWDRYYVTLYGGGGAVFPQNAINNAFKLDFSSISEKTTIENGVFVRNGIDGAIISKCIGVPMYINPVPPNPETEKNILIIGDSLVAQEGNVKRIREKLDNYGLTNYKLVGRQAQPSFPDVRYEAVGGYTWNNYTDDPATLPAGYPNNFFWDSTAGAASMQHYMTTYCGGKNLDFLICAIGWNHRVNGAYYPSTTISDIKAKAIAFITMVHTQYPNCKILLVGIQKTYVGHGLEPSEIRSYHAFCSQLNRVYKDIATNPLYAPYVRFLQMSAQFNSQTGHKLALSDANEYSDEEITYCTDFVHPSPTFGAKMWGDAIWRGFVGLTHMP